jgi:hypothetical protein
MTHRGKEESNFLFVMPDIAGPRHHFGDQHDAVGRICVAQRRDIGRQLVAKDENKLLRHYLYLGP